MNKEVKGNECGMGGRKSGEGEKHKIKVKTEILPDIKLERRWATRDGLSILGLLLRTQKRGISGKDHAMSEMRKCKKKLPRIMASQAFEHASGFV